MRVSCTAYRLVAETRRDTQDMRLTFLLICSILGFADCSTTATSLTATRWTTVSVWPSRATFLRLPAVGALVALSALGSRSLPFPLMSLFATGRCGGGGGGR